VRMICESVGQTPDETRNHVQVHSLIYQSVYQYFFELTNVCFHVDLLCEEKQEIVNKKK
jgi:hypothetical protein